MDAQPNDGRPAGRWTLARFRPGAAPLALLLLVAAFAVWTLGRASWTPDEPREWGIASAALAGDGLVVPQLSGEPFVEKPPLTYWASAASMAAFGRSVAAARAPNLLWALISVLSVAACAAAMVPAARRRQAVWLVVLVMPTMLLTFKRLNWLATDAPMLAGVCLALAGLHGATHAPTARRRLVASVAFGVGCAIAFLAKNLWGALVPALAAASFVAWTGREHRARRAALVPGVLVAAAATGLWLVAVAGEPNGPALLREFLWDNSVGRFLPVDSAAHHYLHHAHARGAMLMRLPLMTFPWTFAAFAALWACLTRAWRRGESAAQRDRARFAVCCVVPGLIVVGISATARDIYLLPCLPGLVLALVLLVFDGDAAAGPKWWTRATAATLWGGTLLLAAAAWCYVALQFEVPAAAYTIALLVIAAWSTAAMRHAPRAADAFATLALAQVPPLLAVLVVGGALALPAVNRDQDVYAFVERSTPLWPSGSVVVLRHEENVRAALAGVMGRSPLLASDLDDARAQLRADPSRRLLFEIDDDPLTPRARRILARVEGLLIGEARALPPARPAHGSPRLGDGIEQIAEVVGPAGRRYGVYGASLADGALSPFVDNSLPRRMVTTAPVARPVLSSPPFESGRAGRASEPDRSSHTVPF